MCPGVGVSGCPRIKETNERPSTSSCRTCCKTRLTAVGRNRETRSASDTTVMVGARGRRDPVHHSSPLYHVPDPESHSYAARHRQGPRPHFGWFGRCVYFGLGLELPSCYGKRMPCLP